MMIDRDVLARSGYEINEKDLERAEKFLSAMYKQWDRTGYAVTMTQVEKELGVSSGGAGDSYRILRELGLVRMAPGEIDSGRFTLWAIKINEYSLFLAAA